MNSLLKKPSAWVPIVIPLVFFAYIIIAISLFGVVRQEDEGTPAHLFQLWLVLEPFMVGYFAFTWWPKMPRQALFVVALQVLAALLPISIVFTLNL